MKNDTPYLLGIADEKVLHIGLKAVANHAAVVYEPVTLFNPQIFISHETGPLILYKNRIWPVRTYDIPFSIDRIKSLPKYAEHNASLNVYPFERYLFEGKAVRLKLDASNFLDGKIGKPSTISQQEFREMRDRVDVVSTDQPDEYRLLITTKATG